MKKLIIVCYYCMYGILFSCSSNKTVKNLYNDGDVVYLKPDSTKALIWRTYNGECSILYEVTYSDSLHVRRSDQVYEYEIYNKK